MIIYDTTQKHMMIGGSGIEIMADMSALITRAFYQIAGEDIAAARVLIGTYSKMLAAMATNDGLMEALEKDSENSTTINLSHLMNKQE